MFSHPNMIFDIYYSRSKSQEPWGWDNKKLLGAQYSTDYFLCLPVFAIWFFKFILQSPKLSVHVSTCYQWRLDYRIGAQLIRNGKTKVSSEPTWSRAAKSCVHGKFPSSLKRFHLYVYHTTLVTLVRDWGFPIANAKVQVHNAEPGIVEIERRREYFFTIYLFEKVKKDLRNQNMKNLLTTVWQKMK